MVRKALLGLIIAAAAIGATPVAATAATLTTSSSQQWAAESGPSGAEKADQVEAMMPIVGLWAGVGVLGLAGGMITISTISRKQKPEVSRVAAALS